MFWEHEAAGSTPATPTKIKNMFGFRKMTTNDECEIIRLKGKLEGLTQYHDGLIKVSERPDNRSDLSEEIKRVKNEIIMVEGTLKEMKKN